jgi:3'(2'), 5'-bisphosphate nucleotidase/myo-inositol-1(or 4)-monophosphatase
MLEKVSALLGLVGAEMLTWRGGDLCDGHWEGGQLKTVADQEAHRLIKEGLAKIAPLPCISEEDAYSHVSKRPEIYWLIDPIDGTASFCNGFDGFVTQVALMRNCQPVLAVVHAPALGLTYTSSLDEPALCNRAPISTAVSGTRVPILIDNYPEPRGIARRLYDEIGCSGYVESGSIGLKICRVADGTADLFVKDITVRDWDLAPAHLILARAGGLLTTLAGNSWPYDDAFEKVGVIASCNRELSAQVAKWNRNRTKTVDSVLDEKKNA